MFDFSKAGRERYGRNNLYQLYCKKHVRDRLSSLRERYPNYVFDIDESGKFINAYSKIDITKCLEEK